MWILLGVWLFGAIATAALFAVGYERDQIRSDAPGVCLMMIAFWPITWVLVAMILILRQITGAETAKK